MCACVCDYVDSRCTLSGVVHDDGLNKLNTHRSHYLSNKDKRQNSKLGTCSSKGIQHHYH